MPVRAARSAPTALTAQAASTARSAGRSACSEAGGSNDAEGALDQGVAVMVVSWRWIGVRWKGLELSEPSSGHGELDPDEAAGRLHR